MIDIQISYVFQILITFGVTAVWLKDKLLQIVVFLTYSVSVALCAYFDESMDFIGGV